MAQNKEQKTINNIYALVCVSLLMGFIPVIEAAVLCLVMFLAAFIAAYILRKRAAAESLTANHMTFIIRTIWIASLFLIGTMTVAIIYLLPNYDPSALDICNEKINALIMEGVTDVARLEAEIKPCMDNFMADNFMTFMIATAIAAGPVVIYMGYRLARGLSRAIKGHRIGDVKGWF